MESEKLLAEIAYNTRSKSHYPIIVTGKDAKIVTTFEPPIRLDPEKRYELAFLNLETWYTFPNIDDTNNQFCYRKSKDSPWKTITIPKGSYEVTAINCVIQSAIEGC